MINTPSRVISHIISSISLLLIAVCFKVSFIVGSKMGFFNAYDLVNPVLGGLGCSWLAILMLPLRLFWSSMSPILYFIRHIPGLIGVAYWNTQSWIVRLFVPAACMALFLVHPVGSQAYAYTFYWLIPMSFYLFNVQGVIAQAFGSTFVVHAVGSVIWLYTVPMNAAHWWALIPVVFVERCIAAGGMIFVYTVIKAWTTYLSPFSIHENSYFKKASKVR